MSRRPPGDLLRWLLAAMILVAGFGSPVRYGHAHAHHGPHEHHGGAGDHEHDHGPPEGVVGVAADLPALGSVAFHWHDTFAPPFGLPAPDSGGDPSQVAGPTTWIAGDGLPGTSALLGSADPSLPPTALPFDRLAPPPDRAVLRVRPGSDPPASPTSASGRS